MQLLDIFEKVFVRAATAAGLYYRYTAGFFCYQARMQS
jgi:hypothetical protein